MEQSENNKNKIYYSIKEVAEQLHESEPTLRYWESEFNEWITPMRNERGARFYTDKDIADIRLIRYLLRDQKLTLDGARQKLKHNKSAAAKQEELVNRLHRVKAEMQSLLRAFDAAAKEGVAK